jgi:2Fe-2S ferredoxin
MIAIDVTDRAGQRHTLKTAPDGGLMELLRDNNMGIEAICGGGCSCATCHVFIATQWASRLPPRTDMENDLLLATESYRLEESRLSCQIPLKQELDGLEVVIAPED